MGISSLRSLLKTVGFAEKISVTKRMGILKTVELADFAEKNAKRIRSLKTVGLADFREKSQKNGNGMLKNENSNVVVRQSELKPLHCNVLLLCQSQEKRICERSLFFECF